MIVDVDHFKHYNDAFGHLQGDTCLVAVAAALSGVASHPNDFVARYGGEEFAVVLPGTDERGAATIAEQVRQSVERLRIAADMTPSYVTVSAGYATSSGNPFETPETLVAAADARFIARRCWAGTSLQRRTSKRPKQRCAAEFQVAHVLAVANRSSGTSRRSNRVARSDVCMASARWDSRGRT